MTVISYHFAIITTNSSLGIITIDYIVVIVGISVPKFTPALIIKFIPALIITVIKDCFSSGTITHTYLKNVIFSFST